MADFTQFRANFPSLINSSDGSSVEFNALPVLESPVNPPSFILSSIADDSHSENSEPKAASPKALKHKHKLTKARAAALSISLKGTKVGCTYFCVKVYTVYRVSQLELHWFLLGY